MVALLWETLLLLLAAYFLGAFLGCMLRRLFAGGKRDKAVIATGAAAAGTAAVAAGAQQSNRFERALTGEGQSGSVRASMSTQTANSGEQVSEQIEQISPRRAEDARGVGATQTETSQYRAAQSERGGSEQTARDEAQFGSSGTQPPFQEPAQAEPSPFERSPYEQQPTEREESNWSSGTLAAGTAAAAGVAAAAAAYASRDEAREDQTHEQHETTEQSSQPSDQYSIVEDTTGNTEDRSETLAEPIGSDSLPPREGVGSVAARLNDTWGRSEQQPATEQEPLGETQAQTAEVSGGFSTDTTQFQSDSTPGQPETSSSIATGATVAAGVAGAAVAASAVQAAAIARPDPGEPNDLEDIRGIDADTAARLRDMGIERWAQIAELDAAEADRVDRTLGLNGAIARDNWMEQASILAAGGTTVYATRRALGDVSVASPTDDRGPAREIVSGTGIAAAAATGAAALAGRRSDDDASSEPASEAGTTTETYSATEQADMAGSATVRDYDRSSGATGVATALAASRAREQSGNEPTVTGTTGLMSAAADDGSSSADSWGSARLTEAGRQAKLSQAEVGQSYQPGQAQQQDDEQPSSLGTTAAAIAAAGAAAAAAIGAATSRNEPTSDGAQAGATEPQTTAYQTGQDATGQDATGQAEAGQYAAGQAEAGQDISGQYQTGEYDRTGEQVTRAGAAAAAARAVLDQPTQATDDMRFPQAAGTDGSATVAAEIAEQASDTPSGASDRFRWDTNAVPERSVSQSSGDTAGLSRGEGDDGTNDRGGWLTAGAGLAGAAAAAAAATGFASSEGDASNQQRSGEADQTRAISDGASFDGERGEYQSTDETTSSSDPGLSGPGLSDPGRSETGTLSQSALLAGSAATAAAAVVGSQSSQSSSSDWRATDGSAGVGGLETGRDTTSSTVTGLRSVRSEALTGGASMPLRSDDLKRIRGLGVLDERRLNSIGVTTYSQIADWNADDVADVNDRLALRGRVGREGWIEQAQMLYSGTVTSYAQRMDRVDVATSAGDGGSEAVSGAQTHNGGQPIGGSNDEVTASGQAGTTDYGTDSAAREAGSERPRSSFADTITTIGGIGAAGAAAAAVGSGLVGGSDEAEQQSDPATQQSGQSGEGVLDQGGSQGGLASLSTPVPASDLSLPEISDPSREAGSTLSPSAVAAGSAATAAAATATAAGSSGLQAMRSVRSSALVGESGGGLDDLKRIRGIGILIEKKLNTMGVTRYQQIANWTQADVAQVNSGLSFQNRIEREKWIEQARILAAGGETEFSRRVDRGDI